MCTCRGAPSLVRSLPLSIQVNLSHAENAMHHSVMQKHASSPSLPPVNSARWQACFTSSLIGSERQFS